VTTRWTFDRHPPEDAFEDYAFDRLSPEDTSDFEEHLLVCEKCQQTLAETDDYVRLMKSATAAYVAEQPVPRESTRLWGHGLRWNAVGALFILLTCLTAVLSLRTPHESPKPVVLEAYRTGGIAAATRCPAGKPLELKISLADVQPAAGYRVEVVDASGNRIWFGGTPALLTKGLAPGKYWVRLSTDAGVPLREFGLIAAR
jgi:hypothetical protein